MKTQILSVLLVMTFFSSAFSQVGDSILFKKGKHYTMNHKRLSGAQIEKIYQVCHEALKKYDRGKSLKTLGMGTTVGVLTYTVVSTLFIRVYQNQEYSKWWNLNVSPIINKGIGLQF